MSLCGNDTRSPVTSRESAAHGHTQREGKIHGARPLPPATPRAAPAWPSARGPHSPAPRSPYPPRGAPTRRGPALQSTELVSQVSAGRFKPAARWRRLRSRRTGEWLQHPCRGGGREQGRGRVGGLPGERSPGGAPTPAQGRVAGAGAGRPRARRAHCAARPFVPARNAAAPWRSGEHARRAGAGGDAQWNSPRRHRPTRAARRPRTPAGRRDGAAGAAGRLCEASGGLGVRAPPGCGWERARRAKGGCQSRSRGRGLEGDTERGAGGPRSRRSEGRCLRSQQMERGRPAAATAGDRQRTGTGPAARGRGAPSRAVHGAVRGSRCPGAGGGPGALGVRPTGARPSRPAAEPEPWRPPPLVTAPSLFLVNVIPTQTWCTPRL